MLKLFSLSDKQIINNICSSQENEGKSIQYLLDKNRQKINSFVSKNNGNKSDAETVLVEGVTHLVFNIRKGDFQGGSSLNTYLYTICRRVWYKTLKKRGKYADFESSELLISDDSDSPLAQLSEQDLKEEMSFLLNQIGAACQQVLNLWAEHYSMKEIALRMNYKNAQISMNKKNRCLDKLKTIVKENAQVREVLKSYLN